MPPSGGVNAVLANLHRWFSREDGDWFYITCVSRRKAGLWIGREGGNRRR